MLCEDDLGRKIGGVDSVAESSSFRRLVCLPLDKI